MDEKAGAVPALSIGLRPPAWIQIRQYVPDGLTPTGQPDHLRFHPSLGLPPSAQLAMGAVEAGWGQGLWAPGMLTSRREIWRGHVAHARPVAVPSAEGRMAEGDWACNSPPAGSGGDPADRRADPGHLGWC